MLMSLNVEHPIMWKWENETSQHHCSYWWSCIPAAAWLSLLAAAWSSLFTSQQVKLLV
jgi:hypothetical protein